MVISAITNTPHIYVYRIQPLMSSRLARLLTLPRPLSYSSSRSNKVRKSVPVTVRFSCVAFAVYTSHMRHLPPFSFVTRAQASSAGLRSASCGGNSPSKMALTTVHSCKGTLPRRAMR